MIPQSRHGKSRAQSASRNRKCLGDPACVWPATVDGLCIHHFRMSSEAEVWEAEAEPESEDRPKVVVPPELLAALQRSRRREPAGYCRNTRCGAPIRINNHLGLCKKCGDRFRSFLKLRGRKRQLSIKKYLARRLRHGLG